MTQPPDNRTCAHGCVGLEFCWASARVAAECFTPVSEDPKRGTTEKIRIRFVDVEPRTPPSFDDDPTAESPKDAVKDDRLWDEAKDGKHPAFDELLAMYRAAQEEIKRLTAPAKADGFDALTDQFGDLIKDQSRWNYDPADCHLRVPVALVSQIEIALNARRSIPPMDVRAVAERIGEEVLIHEDDDYKTCAARYCATCGSYSSHCLRRNPKHEFTPRPCDCSVIASKEQIADIIADELSQLTRGDDK